MEEQGITNEQLNKILEMIKTIAKKCDTVDEVVEEIDRIKETQ